jgi:hypothetical protein
MLDQVPPDDGPPPFFGKWQTVYRAVLLYLATLILILYLATRVFSY